MMAELKQVARMSSETAHAVTEMIKQVGSLRDLLQPTFEHSVGSSRCHIDSALATLSAQLNAQMQHELGGLYDDLGQHVDTAVSRHSQQLTQLLNRHSQQITQQL